MMNQEIKTLWLEALRNVSHPTDADPCEGHTSCPTGILYGLAVEDGLSDEEDF